MVHDIEELDAAIVLLDHPQAKKRESGAKRLRKLANPEAGKYLLAALRKEVVDPRMWSSQYHMILALGLCMHRPALPFLWEMARSETEHTTLYYGLGDAIVRIGRKSDHDMKPIFEMVETRRFELANGALHAMALLRLVPKDAEIVKLIKIAELPEAVEEVHGYPNDECGLRQWVAAAAAGWPRDIVHDFLERCLNATDDNLRLAAEQSLKGKYVKWGDY